MKSAPGFSTMEALCALMLLNLLGVGLLLWQWQAMQAQKEALAFRNAVDMAQELWQRMQINPSAVGNYQLGLYEQAPSWDCHSQACSPAQWARADLAEWQHELQVRIPGAKAQLETKATSTFSLTLIWPSALQNLTPNPADPACPENHRCWQTTWAM